MKKIVIFFMLIIVGITSFSDDQDWIILGDKTVAYKQETDSLNIKKENREISKIKIESTQGIVKLKEIKVIMEDGTEKTYKPKGTGIIEKGRSSFAFDLPGKDKKIKTVELKYDSVGNILITKRAKVNILGKLKK